MSLRNLGAQTRLAASFQMMSIVGGAIAPPLMGWLADQYHSMAVCLAIPLLGFIAPIVYGLSPRSTPCWLRRLSPTGGLSRARSFGTVPSSFASADHACSPLRTRVVVARARNRGQE